MNAKNQSRVFAPGYCNGQAERLRFASLHVFPSGQNFINKNIRLVTCPADKRTVHFSTPRMDLPHPGQFFWGPENNVSYAGQSA
jgi:hypothetical protein